MFFFRDPEALTQVGVHPKAPREIRTGYLQVYRGNCRETVFNNCHFGVGILINYQIMGFGLHTTMP